MFTTKLPGTIARIETKRLILRTLTETDIPFLLSHFSKNEINEYSSAENLNSLREAREFYEKYIAPRPELFRLGIILKESGELVGTLGLYGIDHANMRAVVGYDLVKEFWGKGLMTEALRALVDYGFEQIGLNKIEATADTNNLRSLRVVERCGFRKEGVLRQKSYYKGAFHNEAVYSMLKYEWNKKPHATT